MLLGNEYVFLQVLARRGGAATGVARKSPSNQMQNLINEGYCALSRFNDGTIQVEITEIGSALLQQQSHCA